MWAVIRLCCYAMIDKTLFNELNRYAELLYKRFTEEFYPVRQLSFLA